MVTVVLLVLCVLATQLDCVPIPNHIAVFSLLGYFGLEICMNMGKNHFSFKMQHLFNIFISKIISIY